MAPSETKEEKITETPRLAGTFEHFVPGANFEDYLERLENYFEMNFLHDSDYKKRMFLNFIGEHTYVILKKLLVPKVIKNVTYEECKTTLSSYFAPKKTCVLEAVDFYKRMQYQGESVADYAAELQSLSTKCEFGTYQDRALRDKFVAGLLNLDIQRDIMSSESVKTFEEAVHRAKTLEKVQVEQSKIHSRGENVNRLNANNGSHARRDRGRSKSRNWNNNPGRSSSSSRQNNDGSYIHNFTNSHKHYSDNISSQNKNNFNKNYRDSKSKSKSKDNREIICYRCDRKGHIAKFCPERVDSNNHIHDSIGHVDEENDIELPVFVNL